MGARPERMGEELASGWEGMIDAKRLLSDCQALVRQLEADLRDEFDERPEIQAALKREHHEATVAKRTRRSAEEWTAERITQAAAAWVLGCVFVRFLEDTGLVETARLSGPGERLRQAREQQTEYFHRQPSYTAREYLLETFRTVAVLPGCAGLFDERTNPLFSLPISGDAARELVEAWRSIDPESGVLVHDFTDPARSTRFLGDLYQDISEAAKKQYALLQTPEFVEEFILERTLEPAIDEFGLAEVRLIDPACGSGHFLLGAFARLLAHWKQREPGTDVRTLVERGLRAVSGVDLNPYAAEISRFRLLIAATHACEVRRLRDAPDLRPDVAVGDALLHGTRPGQLFADSSVASAATTHLYATEDSDAIAKILDRRYHVVVANPPYITPKDPALNDAYRRRFSACSGTYALTVPFMQLLFDLALPPSDEKGPGYVGQITSNSFMKRAFGKRLIEDHLAKLDLTLIVDTSVAYIPGHGTPTVILVGRSRPPIAPTIRAVMGIRGESTTPADPGSALVWTAIKEQVDCPSSESAFVTVEDVPRDRFATHPWTISGGGASQLRERIERHANSTLDATVDYIGYTGQTNADEAMTFADATPIQRLRLEPELAIPLVLGEAVRDWRVSSLAVAFVPYLDDALVDLREYPGWLHYLWPLREVLLSRATFSKQTYRTEGRPWYEWHLIRLQRLRDPLSLCFSNVMTHNHFALQRDPVVLNSHAPGIKLVSAEGPERYIEYLGLLNSSVACFWIKQVCHSKGGGGINEGLRGERWEFFFEVSAKNIDTFPVSRGRPASRSRLLEELAQRLASHLPDAVAPTRSALSDAREEAETLRASMIAVQEELDWEVYALYGILDEDLSHPSPPPIRFGERAFEISLARRMAAGRDQTSWFDRHQATPTRELPAHWPDDYRNLVETRIELIESHRDLALIERPEYKRRWQWEPWERQQEQALRSWLLDRLEDRRYWGGEPQLTSCARLADELRKDGEFRSVAELYAGRADVDLARLVEELALREAVPYLAAWRYTDGGMRTRTAWERTWELQRQEDVIDAHCELPENDPHQLTPEQAKARKQVEVGMIPVPPKYGSKDFRKSTYWSLRGKLDVPKERFILYPGCERAADPSRVIGWAGWSHLERSQALAQYVTRMRQEEHWETEGLTPLLAGLAEQLPWVMQWHNEFDPSLGRRVGDAYSDFLGGQLTELGLSPEDIAAWRPPEATRGRRARRVAV